MISIYVLYKNLLRKDISKLNQYYKLHYKKKKNKTNKKNKKTFFQHEIVVIIIIIIILLLHVIRLDTSK